VPTRVCGSTRQPDSPGPLTNNSLFDEQSGKKIPQSELDFFSGVVN